MLDDMGGSLVIDGRSPHRYIYGDFGAMAVMKQQEGHPAFVPECSPLHFNADLVQAGLLYQPKIHIHPLAAP
ncbi:hypothetical protein D1872_291540 [compost metagenome]